MRVGSLVLVGLLVAGCAHASESDFSSSQDEPALDKGHADDGSSGDGFTDGSADGTTSGGDQGGDVGSGQGGSGTGSGPTSGSTSTTGPTGSSTGSGGSPAQCDSAGDCQTCIDCSFQGMCSAVADACFNDAACTAVDNCMYGCSPADYPCQDGCLQMNGASMWIDVASCVFCNACFNSCPEDSASCQ